jgi:Sec-independent protein translocase protein TatA
VLLFVIGLLVLGPQKLPKVAAEIGKWVGRARRTATQLRRQLEREIELSEIQPPKPPPPQAEAPQHAQTPPTAAPPTAEQAAFDAAAEHGWTGPPPAVEDAPAGHGGASDAPPPDKPATP